MVIHLLTWLYEKIREFEKEIATSVPIWQVN